MYSRFDLAPETDIVLSIGVRALLTWLHRELSVSISIDKKKKSTNDYIKQLAIDMTFSNLNYYMKMKRQNKHFTVKL